MSFSDLLLAEPILRAVVSEGYTVATPVQAEAIPHIMQGRDVMGCAQTGTGKTAAFALPILHRLSIVARPGGPAKPRCLVLCPTRELATQIGDSFRVYGKHVPLRHACIYGGVGIRPQIDTLRRGVDIIIATPGRLLDLMQQNCCDISAVEVLVLDEADRMLDMGFMPDIRKIISKLPARRQTLLFSATLPPDIKKLAGAILRDAVTVQVARQSPAADRIEQCVYHITRAEKPGMLADLVKDLPMTRPIVFTRTKHGADRLVKRLYMSGIRAEAIHGNKSQNNRQRALEGFRSGRIHVLVATDVASRGIDVDGITHVVNYDVTDEPETYVHRIGRTARAGASGMAITFCDPEERSDLRAIERLMGKSIPVKTRKVTPGTAAEQTAEHHEGRHGADDARPAHHQEKNGHGSPAEGGRQRSPQGGGGRRWEKGQHSSRHQYSDEGRSGDSHSGKSHGGKAHSAGRDSRSRHPERAGQSDRPQGQSRPQHPVRSANSTHPQFAGSPQHITHPKAAAAHSSGHSAKPQNAAVAGKHAVHTSAAHTAVAQPSPAHSAGGHATGAHASAEQPSMARPTGAHSSGAHSQRPSQQGGRPQHSATGRHHAAARGPQKKQARRGPAARFR